MDDAGGLHLLVYTEGALRCASRPLTTTATATAAGSGQEEEREGDSGDAHGASGGRGSSPTACLGSV